MTQSSGVGRGSKRKPIIAKDVALIPDAPIAPSDLSDAGRELWSVLWNGGRRWLDVGSDVVLIEMIVRASETLMKVNETLRTDGRYYQTPQGHWLVHPAVVDARNLSANIVSWLSLAGFSASDRARLNVPMMVVTDPLEKWRERNRRELS